ncbi:MAG: nucleotidyltransferase substrate binding protein [Deltaproteobacteria bacterium]|nr:nucleotidyltransferase substrate binding protein [Deltaproteobacteria bacterium]
MSTARLELSLDKLGLALDRLDEVLALPGEGPMIDATIQRFEFTFELFWKTLKRALEESGEEPRGSPRDVLSFAWHDKWLEGDENLWLGMLGDRNVTSHVYSEADALEIYRRIRTYAAPLRRAYADLRRRFRLAASPGPSGSSRVREPRVPCEARAGRAPAPSARGTRPRPGAARKRR